MVETALPRLEISLSKIRENTKTLSKLYGVKGMSLMGVSKVVLGDPQVVQAMVDGGVAFIADSRIENIIKMKKEGIKSKFVLLRTTKSDAKSIVENVDISLNTEIEILKEISFQAKALGVFHKVIIMVDVGDLREGVMPEDLIQFIKKVLKIPRIKIIGIGCNLACFGGIKPDENNMNRIDQLARDVERQYNIRLRIISGGNSANYNWFQSVQKVGVINNIRLGESIFLGLESIQRKKIPDLHTDIFRLFGEVIELKKKPSVPEGELTQDGFGNIPVFVDRGISWRAIVALGRQDVEISKLQTIDKMEILGASSDHIILNPLEHTLKVGDEVGFKLNYSNLLRVMTSPFVKKVYV